MDYIAWILLKCFACQFNFADAKLLDFSQVTHNIERIHLHTSLLLQATYNKHKIPNDPFLLTGIIISYNNCVLIFNGCIISS